MEREIKFRGRSRKDGKWAYGDLLRHDDGEVLIGVHSEGWTDDGFHFDVYKCVVPVYEESVGQFTGLHDANGNDIYEGDILADGNITYRVVFADFQWCVESDRHRQGIRCLRFIGECKVNVTVLEAEPEGDAELNESGLAIGKASEEYEMVDLGLSVKWADRNVGAASPEAYGDYFMWGSTTPDTGKPCDWAHCPFNNGQEGFDKTYFNAHKSEFLTDKGTLKPEYDAAHVIMGGSWRMPTSAEMQELIDGTDRETGTVEGVKGMFFINKSDAAKRIFMPLCGGRNGSDVYYVGNHGYAWSSSLYAGNAYNSHSLGFDDHGNADVYYSNRCSGFAVRGVC